MKDKVMLARAIAEYFHDGQKYSDDMPYFRHVERVANEVWKLKGDDDLQCAAYLHDTLEDTELSDTAILELFGVQVSVDVQTLTRAKSIESYAKYIKRVANHPRAAIIKRCDLQDNLRECKRLPADHPKRSLISRYEDALKVLEQEATP